VQQKILKHYEEVLKKQHLRQLLDDDARNKALVCEHDGVLLDYSHEKLDQTMLGYFEELAASSKVYDRVEQMLSGKKVNPTEGRAVLHSALRAPPNMVIEVDGKNQVPEVHNTLKRVQQFSDSVRSGEIKGHTGKPLTTVVDIGIGGSYLGVEFVYEALRSQSLAVENAKGRRIRFLANVDPVDFARTVDGLDVENCLFVISSKTFTTAETMFNARACRQWILDQYTLKGAKPEEHKAILSAHLCAISTNLEATSKFGISDDKVFGFWDWVGGRFSVTSAIGMLPLSLHFGFAYMLHFLEGAHKMDEHFRTKKVSQNIPLLLGMIGWYRATI
jgi:glucose-6-phosphate isomerase